MTIIGYTDLAGRLPTQASQLYGTNLVNLMKLLTPGKDGQLVLDFDDVVQRGMTVARDGEMTVAAAADPGLRGPGRAVRRTGQEPSPPSRPPKVRAGRYAASWAVGARRCSP